MLQYKIFPQFITEPLKSLPLELQDKEALCSINSETNLKLDDLSKDYLLSAELPVTHKYRSRFPKFIAEMENNCCGGNI